MNSSRKNFIKSMAIGASTALSYPLIFKKADENSIEETTSTTNSRAGSITVLNVKDFGAEGDGSTDDTQAIQRALSKSKTEQYEIVYVPDGIYHISEILVIYENTTLQLNRNAVIIRKADINAMLINGTEDVAGFDGQSNITVQGGTWDGNSREFPSNVTPLGFGHARNITVQNLTVLDVYNWHHVEINAIDGATIQDCLFDGMILTREYTEMVQIDLMGAEGMFPWFGKYDHTTCRNVLINRCIFQNGDTAGIGTHSTREDARHEYITITNCEFINLKREGIVAQNWQNVNIENNFFRKCNQGVFIEALSDTDCKDITITKNKMLDLDLSADSNAIQIHSEKSGSQIRHILINGNFLSNIGSHGIEIDYCDYATIRNNTVKNCKKSGIWSNQSNNLSIAENVAFNNATGEGSEDKDIRFNSTEAEHITKNHIVTSNNIETCRIEAVDQCLLSNNIIKTELVKDADCTGVNNYIKNEFYK